MPLLNEGTRYMIDMLKSRINEVVFGFDGSVATQDDGGIGRPAITVTPKVRILDDHSILVEAELSLDTEFTQPLKEVVIQYKNPADPTDTTSFFRYTYDSLNKTNNNELHFSTIIEVNA